MLTLRTCVASLLAIAIVNGAIPSLRAAEPTEEEQKRVDDSISRALVFLAKEQQQNGCWRVDAAGDSTAATSLAVMAFLAAGHVPGEGPYGETLNRGIRWVLDHQQANGMIVHRTTHGPMYDHGIATLMLAEVVGMVDRKLADEVRRVLQKGIKLILDAQNVPKNVQHAGGWRYNPTSTDSDLSVTGWQLLALRAAKGCGCDVPAESIDKAVSYVRRCARGGRGFGYMPGAGGTQTLTGVGILALEICGEHNDELAVDGAEFLRQRPLEYRGHYYFYGVYYCTVGLFKVGGDHWENNRQNLTGTLLDNQHAGGSWQPAGGSEAGVGAVYSTSLAVLALAVDYQYLPIYQR